MSIPRLLQVIFKVPFNRPVGDRGELQRAERLGAAEGQTDGCSHPSPRRHDAE